MVMCEQCANSFQKDGFKMKSFSHKLVKDVCQVCRRKSFCAKRDVQIIKDGESYND